MEQQTYANHTRIVTGYHMVLFGLGLATLIGSCINLYKSVRGGGSAYDASLIVALTICLGLTAFYARIFALKAQDRAIRAEENLRHYVLTGKLLDPRINTRQVIGLRFCSDQELSSLANRAAEERLSEKQIKQAVKSWRADHYRV